jgi:secreted trypsin-like serine protease
MRCSWVVLTGLAAVVACSGPDAGVSSARQAIVAGTPDTGDPAIMEVLGFRGPSGVRCTATLVAPRILLLAAHCFVETQGFDQRFVFPGNNDGNAPSVNNKNLLPIKTFVYDQQYTAPRQGHDFAIVVLDAPMAVPPVRINRAPLDKAQGKTVRYVGYGLDTVGNFGTGGVKRQNSAPLATVSPLLLSIAPNAHGACEGDSGGPLLIDDGQGEAIAGVGSFVANPACLRDSFYQRLDTQVAWLDQQIQKYDPRGMEPADAGADGMPATMADAGTPADADEPDAAPTRPQPLPDAGPADATHAPAMEPEPTPPETTPSKGGGCDLAESPRGGAGVTMVLALALIGRRRRSRPLGQTVKLPTPRR